MTRSPDHPSPTIRVPSNQNPAGREGVHAAAVSGRPERTWRGRPRPGRPTGIEDRRSGRVAFVSHCLLNQNVRYLGGATQPGVLPGIADRYVAAGVGICQMPCPEQQAWGGVLKPLMTRWYGSRLLRSRTGQRLVARLATTWTQERYRGLARRVARDIADYQRAGLEVVEVLGVGASPSCGVTTTVELESAMAAMGRCDRRSVDALTVNREVVAANVARGAGLFIQSLRRELAKRGVAVAFIEHDLLEELRGQGLLPRAADSRD